MKTNIKIISVFLVVVILVLVVSQGLRLRNYKKLAAETNIEAINVANVKDGKYEGEYDMDFIFVSLSVAVENGNIANIEILKHKHERGAEAEKQIPQRILKQQSIKVDAVSGATNSSKAIMKSVELALQKGLGS